MIFNSLSFLIFLPIVFTLYWTIQRRTISWQNSLLLLASFYFYACWDWRFLFLLLLSICLDFFTGKKIEESDTPTKRKIWLVTSICINLGFLFIFKYYNFFIESFVAAVNQLGYYPDAATINIVLPVGISFYTFHGLSYVLDVYYGRISSERKFTDYALFVSFFPLLVAGPIERATHLLPQVKNKRTFDPQKAVDGLRQILWGLFKKVVIADNCGLYVNEVFSNYQQYDSVTLTISSVLFAFQIYCDFSGYSDIALGTARLFGFELLKNFSFPYFSRNIAEFWRRWHISLSSWFRDYVYIPLGGSRGNLRTTIRNIFIIFLISGLWHGANWTFIIWGALNAAYFLPSMLYKSNKKYTDTVAQNSTLPSVNEIFHMLLTFSLTTFAWIFFRSESVVDAWNYITHIFTNHGVSTLYPPKTFIVLLLFMIAIEWLGRRSNHALQFFLIKSKGIWRLSFYYILIILILWFAGEQQNFIYFQF